MTSFSIDYYDGKDFVVSGSDSTSWGVEAVQKFDAYSLEGYLGYRVYSFDAHDGSDYDDMSSLLAGARWRF